MEATLPVTCRRQVGAVLPHCVREGVPVMRKSPSRSMFRDGAGNLALIAGIVAVVCAFVPFVGDFVTIPAGVIAVVSGWIGLGRAVEGDASNGRDAVIGAALGGIGLFVVFLTYLASSM
jgi:hypothetical protein